MSKKYDFPVEMVPCYIKDSETGKEIPIKNRVMIYSKEMSKDEVFESVTPTYELVEHKDVVDIVKKNLIPDLGWKIKREETFLYDNGGVMFNMFIAESNYTVGNTKLYSAISAVNSYNRKTRAGVHVALVDEEGNVMIPHAATRMIYVFHGMIHKTGSIDISNLKKLSKTIPAIVNNTIDDWKKWEKEYISGERLRILTQLFNYRMALHVMGLYASGISRFDLYKVICDYMLSEDKMKKSGFHYITQTNKLVKFMKNDYLFNCKLDDLKKYIQNKTQFTWEEKEESKNSEKEEKEEFIITQFNADEIEDEIEEDEITNDILSMFS